MNFNKIIFRSLFYCFICFIQISASESSSDIECENVYKKENSVKLYLERTKRHLTFPNATLFQVNFGVGVPVPLKYKKININLIFQANFAMPWNITQFPDEVLFGPYTSTITDTARRKKRVNSDENVLNTKGENENTDDDIIKVTHTNENTGGNVINVTDQRQNMHNNIRYMTEKRNSTDDNISIVMESVLSEKVPETTASKIEKRETSDSWTGNESFTMKANNPKENDNYLRIVDIYKVLEEHFESYGYNGSDCILKTICQLRAEPLHTEYEDDVLHDIMQLLMSPTHMLDIKTPVSSRPVAVDPVSQRYIEAQISGEENQSCDMLFPYCSLSPADFFTRTFDDNTYDT